MNRTAQMERVTKETSVKISLNIDGSGQAEINTGIGFFDHMLTLFAKHGLFDLSVHTQGDLAVDAHHSVEDTAIVLGQVFHAALADRAKIKRYATVWTPMDEALSMVALDISGRPYLVFDADFPSDKAGQFDSELTEEFLRAFAVHAALTLHVRMMSGKNTHHMIESIFKGLGRALAQAAERDKRITGVMSTKGTLG